MEKQVNVIDMSFLDRKDKAYSYSVLIILNRPIIKSMMTELRKKIDYIICADGASNRLYDTFGIDE
jgi:thiamine pyrophosphokinase